MARAAGLMFGRVRQRRLNVTQFTSPISASQLRGATAAKAVGSLSGFDYRMHSGC